MTDREDIQGGLDSVQDNNVNDWLALAARGGLGIVPWVGGLLGELVTELIPNQRIDRIVRLLDLFAEKITELDKEMLEIKLHQAKYIDLFEDACFQAIRALTEERLDYIASALKHSLTNDQLEYEYKKKLLWLLGQINDVEVIILVYYQKVMWGDYKEFFEQHKEVLFVPPATHGSAQDEIDREILHESYKDHLSQLGLLRTIYHFVPKGELPEFDSRTGKFKRGSLEITSLGRSLCAFIQDGS